MSNEFEYPKECFPQLSREKAEHERKRLFSELEELPTGVIAAALEEARRNLADNPLTQQGGA